MKSARPVLLFFACSVLASAHRLDEYLQAATIAVEQDRITVAMRLSPGVEISPVVLAMIDRNADRTISNREASGYVDQLLGDLSLTLNGESLQLRLISKEFPSIADMRDGLGEIRLELSAPIAAPRPGNQILRFESRHLTPIGAYLVNALVPSDPSIAIAAQARNFTQSSYRLDYSRAGSSLASTAPSTNPRIWLLALALLLTARFLLLCRRPAFSYFAPRPSTPTSPLTAQVEVQKR